MAALVATASFVTVLGVIAGRGPGDAWLKVLAAFVALGVVGVLTVVGSVALVARSAPLGLNGFLVLLIRVWRDSATSWTMFLFGCVLSLPAFALYTPMLVGDSDSARLVASMAYVQRNGVDYLTETQEVLLPHIILGPIMALGGISGLQAFNVLSVVLLGGVVAFVVSRLTRSPLAVLAAVLALNALPAILDRSYRVPMYSTMLSFGFLGLYLSHRAIVAETRSQRWRYALLAGVCLVLSLEAHQVGQLFLVVAALLVVTARASSAAAGLGRVYLVVAVLSVPRLVINLLEGGFSHLLTNRVDFWVTGGYIRSIQTEFFYLPVRDGLGDYLEKAPGSLLDVWGSAGLLTLFLGLVGLLVMSRKLRRFALVCACLLLAVAIYRRLPFYTRYFSLLLVGSALAAGVAFSWLLRRRTTARRVAVGLGLVGLLGSVALSYRTTVQGLQTFERAVVNGPYLRLANAIPPEGGVIGTRSAYLNFASTNVRPFGGQFLTEREYVTFLTWPSEQAVIDVMRRHDIEWVFVPRNPSKWVARYNDTWLLPNHGKRAQYHLEVKQSTLFCRVRKIGSAALYRLDPLELAGDLGARESRRCKAPMANRSSGG